MAVKRVVISSDHAGQRIDNFLLSQLKGVPKTRLYRALRKGEVRVNKKRVKPEYRLQANDQVRIPPLRLAEGKPKPTTAQGILKQIEQAVLLETPDYLVVNKPSGLPVHGGTGINTGLIEALRELRPKAKFLALVHRLDKETSGCILVAKKRSVLVALHELLLKKQVTKRYLALVMGQWQGKSRTVTQSLRKNTLAGGERMVVVAADGKPAKTTFRLVTQYEGAALVEAQPLTGRTHQIRVHASAIKHPIAMDQKYGDSELNKWIKKKSLRRLFLHAAQLQCQLQLDSRIERISVEAPLPADLEAVLQCFQN